MARFDHYIKNLFIVPGFIFHALFYSFGVNFRLFGSFCFALVSTCLISSANYTLNEYLDRHFDVSHPTKSARPAATLELNPRMVAFQYVFFASLGLVLAYICNVAVFSLAVLLLIMGIIYNVEPIRLKDVAVLDVLTESVNNPLRFAIGWYSVSTIHLVPLSALISYFGAGVFLMSLKRHSELNMLGAKAGLYRKSFHGWNSARLLITSVSGGLFGAVFMGIFFVLWKIELILTVPFMIILFSYYFHMSLGTGDAAHAPEKLYRDRKLISLVLLFSLFFLLALNSDIELLQGLLHVDRP
jgi:4-hydroxybenzoate polyprenyltransferase